MSRPTGTFRAIASACVLSLIVWASGSRFAVACSVSSGHLHPSNYDLVKETGAIMLAEAVWHGAIGVGSGWNPGTDRDVTYEIRGFTFRVLEVIKGPRTLETVIDIQGLGDAMPPHRHRRLEAILARPPWGDETREWLYNTLRSLRSEKDARAEELLELFTEIDGRNR